MRIWHAEPKKHQKTIDQTPRIFPFLVLKKIIIEKIKTIIWLKSKKKDI